MTTQYASYERTVTINTFAYTATVVTTTGETTAQLTVRQDLDCPHRRQIQCPGCHQWRRLQWEGAHLLPVHCTGCVLALYNIVEQPAPAVETPEPVAEVAAEPVAQVVEEAIAVVEQAVEAESAAPYPGQCDDCPGRLDPLCCWSTEDKKPTVEKCMILPYEHRALVHMTTEVDRPRYGLKAQQAYYLARSESLSRSVEQPVYWIVVWSYEQCRWVCPCGDPHRSCRHTRAINQDCRDRKANQQPAAIAQTNTVCASCGQSLWRGEDVHAENMEVHITCNIDTVEQQQAA